jgi:hypothetical protein
MELLITLGGLFLGAAMYTAVHLYLIELQQRRELRQSEQIHQSRIQAIKAEADAASARISAIRIQHEEEEKLQVQIAQENAGVMEAFPEKVVAFYDETKGREFQRENLESVLKEGRIQAHLMDNHLHLVGINLPFSQILVPIGLE